MLLYLPMYISPISHCTVVKLHIFNFFCILPSTFIKNATQFSAWKKNWNHYLRENKLTKMLTIYICFRRYVCCFIFIYWKHYLKGHQLIRHFYIIFNCWKYYKLLAIHNAFIFSAKWGMFSFEKKNGFHYNFSRNNLINRLLCT